MKKFISAILAIVMLMGISTVALADYQGLTDGIELNTGLNPVIRTSGDKFDYVIYARDMQGMTNGDLTLTYDTDAYNLISVKQTGNYDHSVFSVHDDGNVYFSFLYSGKNDSAAVKMYILTFSVKQNSLSYPILKATNIAGTFIKSVKDVKVFEATEDNAQISQGANKFEDFMQDDSDYTKGDVNNDGVVTPADARMVLRHCAKLDILFLEQFDRADYNEDGIITTADARLVLRKSAGLSA